MARKQALGKGLDSIFTDNSIEGTNGVMQLRISDIEPKLDQPRKSFDNDSLASLAESISANGILQPILVRETGNGFYQIIAGERRWRAAKLAGLTEVPVIIMEADALKAAEIALIENIQREDLNPFDEAEAYQVLIREYELTQEEISAKLGKSRSAIANALRLLDLPDSIINMLKSGEISAGHGRALLGLRDRDQMLPLATKAAQRNLSVREVESTVKMLNKMSDDNVKAKNPEPLPQTVSVDYINELERRTTSLTGRRVRISNAKNKHIVQIEYNDNRDLENILSKLCGQSIIEE